MNMQEYLENKFKTFIQKSGHPYFCYQHDKEGTFTFVSDNITDLLGYTRQNFAKNYLSALTPDRRNKEVILKTQKALSEGIQQDVYQVEIYDAHLNRRLLEIYESPMMGDNGVEGIEGIAKVLN